MENRLRGLSDLAKITQEPQREWTLANLRGMCCPPAQPMQRLLCASVGFGCLAAVGKDGPGHVPPKSQLSRTSGARKRICNPTAPSCAALSRHKPKSVQVWLEEGQRKSSCSISFFQLAASEISIHLATLPNQTMPGWWPRGVKKSPTRWAKCLWYLLETSQTTKEGDRDSVPEVKPSSQNRLPITLLGTDMHEKYPKIRPGLVYPAGGEDRSNMLKIWTVETIAR